jgi:basic membrane protein A
MITRRRTKTRVIGLALAATISLVGAACGSDDEDADTTSAAPTVAAGTNAPTSAAATTVADESDTTVADSSGADTTTDESDTTTDESDTTGAGSATTTRGSGTTAGAEPAEGATVGLLFDITGRGDKSFNDAAAAGLDQAVTDFAVVGSESTPTSEGDRAERLQQLVDAGNELVVGVGFLWTDAVTAGAQANPDVNFAIIDAVIEEPNVASLTFAEEEGSFLVGVAAGLKTQSNKVGFIGGVETDLIKKFEAGFEAGVKAANPDAEILSQYISQPPEFSGFNDPAKGKEIAGAMYEDGADVVYSAAGGSGLGVFQAASEAGSPGEVWAIGVDSDQYELVGEDLQPYILTSMLKKVDVAVYEAIKGYAEGNFQAGLQEFDVESGGVDYSTSGGFVDDITDEIDEFAQQIISGEIEVPTAPE